MFSNKKWEDTKMGDGNGNENLKKIGKVAAFFVAGSVVGGVAALLLAPKSGAETRQMIKDSSLSAKNKVVEKFDGVKAGAANMISKGKEKISDMKSQSKVSMET
jgi:gas vesicle protein